MDILLIDGIKIDACSRPPDHNGDIVSRVDTGMGQRHTMTDCRRLQSLSVNDSG